MLAFVLPVGVTVIAAIVMVFVAFRRSDQLRKRRSPLEPGPSTADPGQDCLLQFGTSGF
jgi:hypothetical protein